jgi:hypothetical protein
MWGRASGLVDGGRLDLARFSLMAVAADGELRSRVGGAWGVFPTDALPMAISSRPRCWVSFAAQFKASTRWGSSRSGLTMVSSPTMVAGDGLTMAVDGGDSWNFHETQGPWTSM